MPKGSIELTNKRKDEIVNACASLYQTKSFKEITIKDIGAATTFTRTSIYNYYQTKEEIFLALLGREFEAWATELNEISNAHESLSKEEFSNLLARSLEKRYTMLKILAMDFFEIECNSRVENIVKYKKIYWNALNELDNLTQKFFPEFDKQRRQELLYSFMPFLFGVYPYSNITEKQKKAIEIANCPYIKHSIYELVHSFLIQIL